MVCRFLFPLINVVSFLRSTFSLLNFIFSLQVRVLLLV